jgi:lipoprotein-releasing system permease protein
MYRWLLCWRYLRTRYIALASVVSVMLGVATMIIVNAVMDGFTTEMQGRMHGILSDVIVESHSSTGLLNHKHFEQRIRQMLGDDLAGLTTVVHVPAMVSISHSNETITRQINLIGIDTDSYASVSDFSKYLLHPDNKKQLSFILHESGYAPGREGFPESGWQHRRRTAVAQKRIREISQQIEAEQKRNKFLREQMDQTGPSNQETASANHNNEPAAEGLSPDLAFPNPPPELSGSGNTIQTNSVETSAASYAAVPTDADGKGQVFDASVSQRDGMVMGISIGTTRYRDMTGKVTDYYYVQPGDDVTVTFPSAGNTPRAINEKFTIVDFYESQMSEYDATFAFVPLERLQKYRGMIDPVSGNAGVNSIQLKLKPGADLNVARDKLRAAFPAEMMVQVNTWRDLQGALLAAVQMETTILNILLFLIIAVAGFGILATFFMIVVEKTKDIGILKSLGASGTGVASIFLGYGVLLGTVGAGVGGIAGLLFVAYINQIADGLEVITGQEVFDPTVYYFDRIPTIIEPSTVLWVMVGAIMIAVVASVLPAIRAARMHPVEALRYE